MSTPPPSTPPEQRSILVVDDEANIVAALRRDLESAQCEVTTASSAEEGLELARGREFALVISDNIMPGMRGLEFLSIIMSLHPHTRRILVTGFTDYTQAIDAFNHGVLHRYLQKPWNRGALHTMVQEEWQAFVRTKADWVALNELDATLRKRSALLDDALSLIRRTEAELGNLPEQAQVQRRLVVVLIGDVAGFSRLMGENHEQTLKTLTVCRGIIVQGANRYHGRLISAVGDGVLVEFPSAIDAVVCAVELQQELHRINAGLSESRRMEFRFAVNIGDVLVKGGDLFGDGVNVAARLQALAQPGGVCISESVHRQLKSRLPYTYENMGEKDLKNIAEPVKVYQVVFPADPLNQQ
ncbi:MAG: response regulator [Candidatus Lambdaproteobacteria bacterium]|nr:response regulator [Candidatus Lambdaproteobacteria bacterium]